MDTNLLELHTDITILKRQLASILNQQFASTLDIQNSKTSPAALGDSTLRSDTTSTTLRQAVGRLLLSKHRASPYPNARMYAPPPQHIPAPPPMRAMVSSLLTKPRRDYSQMICNLCGKKGHSQYYRGCTLHPNYKPNHFIPTPDAGATSFTQTIVSYTE